MTIKQRMIYENVFCIYMYVKSSHLRIGSKNSDHLKKGEKSDTPKVPQRCHEDWETCKPHGEECIGKYVVKRDERWIERGSNRCREDTEPDTRTQGVRLLNI